MQRIIGRIEVKDDLPGRLPVRLQEQIDQQRFDRHRIMADLVIARRHRPAQLQTIERALARHRRAVFTPRLELARQHRQHRVMAQLVMVVEIFIAERDPEHALAHQRHHLVLDQLRSPHIAKARCKPPRQPDRTIRRPQQQRPGIRGHPPAVKCRDNRAPFHGCKAKQIRATLCRHRGVSLDSSKSLLHNNFLRVRAPMHLSSLRNPG